MQKLGHTMKIAREIFFQKIVRFKEKITVYFQSSFSNRIFTKWSIFSYFG